MIQSNCEIPILNIRLCSVGTDIQWWEFCDNLIIDNTLWRLSCIPSLVKMHFSAEEVVLQTVANSMVILPDFPNN